MSRPPVVRNGQIAFRKTRQTTAPRQWTREEIEASRSRYYQPVERDPIMGIRGRDWDYPEPKGA